MSAMRRFAYVVFGVACTHLVFGAIVRISGSGMGCGPHWPKCYGAWFPPMDRPDLVIEVMHRYLASILLLSLLALLVAAWRRRSEPGVGGPGGVLRMASLATALGFSAAILGAVTVKLANSAPATVAHWTVAMSLVAAVTATLIRAGGLGGASARLGPASAKTRRASLAAAGMALVAVVMGGLTAKVQGGPIACLAFPLCGANPAVPRGAVHVQSGHRVIAVVLILHLIGVFFALRKRGEAPVIRRAATIAFGLGILQFLIAGAMIGMHLPPVLRSLHEATGVSIWIATFTLAYLARLASRDDTARGAARTGPATPVAPLAHDPLAAASIRTASARPVHAQAVTQQLPPARTGASAEAPQTAHHSASVVAAPVLAALTCDTSYEPPALAALAVEHDDAVASVEPARSLDEARRDAPIELPAAQEHAGRAALAAALAFHRTSSRAVNDHADAADDAVHAPDAANLVAVAVADISEIDYADVVDVEMLELVLDAGAMPIDGDVAEGAPAAAAPVEIATSLLDTMDDATVQAAVIHEPVGGVATAAEVAAPDTGTDSASLHDLLAVGGPPVGEATPIDDASSHRIAERGTIFDAASGDEPEDDGLWHLTDPDADQEDDCTAPEHVASLDEEFSIRALEIEADIVAFSPIALPVEHSITSLGDDASFVVSTAYAAIEPAVGAEQVLVDMPTGPRFTSVASLAALRRPAMRHTIAVIVARGADL